MYHSPTGCVTQGPTALDYARPRAYGPVGLVLLQCTVAYGHCYLQYTVAYGHCYQATGPGPKGPVACAPVKRNHRWPSAVIFFYSQKYGASYITGHSPVIRTTISALRAFAPGLRPYYTRGQGPLVWALRPGLPFNSAGRRGRGAPFFLWNYYIKGQSIFDDPGNIFFYLSEKKAYFPSK